MTAYVVDCGGDDAPFAPHMRAAQEAVYAPAKPVRSGPRGFSTALLLAIVLVPIVGLGGRTEAAVAAAVTAASVLIVFRALRGRARWGWLAVLTGGALLVTPTTESATFGPVLFVSSVLFLTFWLANRDPVERQSRFIRQKDVEAIKREAQLLQGRQGELEVGRVLAQELPDGYVLVNGLKLPRGAGDIDHLVVGPYGVHLLETKTMAGVIVCEPDGTWRRNRRGRDGVTYPAYIGDPALQVERNLRAVRGCLRAILPKLFRGTPLDVEGLIVFPHPRTELAVERSRFPGVHLREAVQRIREHRSDRRLEPIEVRAVVETLVGETRQHRHKARLSVPQRAQALVEVALVLPVVVGLAVGIVGVSTIVQAQSAVLMVAHEGARAGALAFDPRDAERRAEERGRQVGANLHLRDADLGVEADVSAFGRTNGRVRVLARYRLNFAPAPELMVHAEHVEWVDPFRSGIAARSGQ